MVLDFLLDKHSQVTKEEEEIETAKILRRMRRMKMMQTRKTTKMQWLPVVLNLKYLVSVLLGDG